MTRMIILRERELRDITRLDHAAVDCVEAAFHALATKAVAMPPILRLDIPEHNGEVDVKTAYVPGIDGFAIKISPGFFDNPKLGLPSLNGMMALFSARTGLIEALMLDNGYLTELRTAAAGAVAAKYLARPDAAVAAIMGAGAQAEVQLQALTLVRPIGEARIWSRDKVKAGKTAGTLAQRLGIKVHAEADPQQAVQDADIIVTTTPASEPILKASWLQAGQHITAMGSDAEQKNELEPAVLAKANLYVADSVKQTRRLGELHHAIEAGLFTTTQAFTELGEIIAGTKPGRQSPVDITIADLTGTGVQDTAIATFARDRAKAAGAGAAFES